MTEAIASKRVNAVFGALFLFCAAGLSCLIFADRWTELSIRFPSFWYTSRGLHLAICVCLYICSWLALRNSSVSDSTDEGNELLFDSFNFYTRPDCCLCDKAMEIMNSRSRFLPTANVINIDEDDQLRERFTDWVPVVELDGRVVFKGQVSPDLLDRLIAGKQNQLRDLRRNTEESNEEPNKELNEGQGE